MKKTLSYFALLLVSGLVFSACIPGLNKESDVEETGEVMEKETGEAMEESGATMLKEDAMELGEDYVNDTVVDDSEAMMKKEGRAISMEMGGFYYAPNVIEAEAGETITVTVKNVKGFHDFVIDELDVATEQVNEGETVTATFTIPEDASGTEYEFYCSVGNHKAQGMVGTLMVK
ncbi:MAG: cupredoxin domain-containing protein [Candidatus Pacebacteria bacterium]|nr:cupredoxin domain-containing protein [Candidatus Paceibacterota bacterium]